MTDHRLKDASTAHAAAVLSLVDNLRAARGAQWEAPPATAMRPPTLLHDDPAGETAVNAERLRLRAAVETGLLALSQATEALDEARASLEAALVPFVSHTVPHAA